MFRFTILISLFLSTLYSRPLWIDNPNFDSRYLGGVGFGSNTNRGRRIAEMIGKAELSEQLSLKVSSSYTSSANGKSLVSRQTSRSLIRHSFINEEWIDPESKRLYLWIVIDSTSLQASEVRLDKLSD